MAYSPDGRRLIAGCADGTVKVWDAETGEAPLDPARQRGAVLSVAVSPDGARIASADVSGAVKVWEDSATNDSRTLQAGVGGVTKLRFSPDSRILASRVPGVGPEEVRLWDLATGQVRHVLPADPGAGLGSPVGEPMHRRYNLRPGAGFRSRRPHAGRRKCRDRTIRLWNVEPAASIGQCPSRRAGSSAPHFRPDGGRLIASNEDGTLTTWDTSNWQPIRTWAAHQGEAYCEAYHPDGGRIVSSGQDGLVKLSDPETGRPRAASLAGHSGEVLQAAYSRDGTRLLSCSAWDLGTRELLGEIILWDSETGNRLLTLAGSRYGPMHEACFSPDGRRLIASNLQRHPGRLGRTHGSRGGHPAPHRPQCRM